MKMASFARSPPILPIAVRRSSRPYGRSRRQSPGAAEPDPEVPDLSGPEFDAILYVALAAARALEGDGAVQEGPGELVAWALAREGRYWRATARPPSRAAGRRRRAGAGRGRGDAHGRGLRGRGGGGAEHDPGPGRDARTQRAVARWLRHLYPRIEGDSCSGLVPDLLGDALVAAVLEESPSIAAGLLDGRAPSRPRACSERSIAPPAPTSG